MNNLILRDTIVQALKKEKGFDKMVSTEINDNYFSAADIVLQDNYGSCEVYRIAVVKHNQQKQFNDEFESNFNVNEMANKLCGENIYEVEGVKDIEYPVELNAFIIVMENGKKYRVDVSEYTEAG